MVCLLRTVLAIDWNHYRRGIGPRAGVDRCPVYFIDLFDQRFALIGSGLQERHRGNQFVINDVAKRPFSTQPWSRIFGSGSHVTRSWKRLVRIFHLPTLLRLKVFFGTLRTATGYRSALLDWAGDSCACGLGPQPDLVAPPTAPCHCALPEVCISRVVDDPFFAGA